MCPACLSTLLIAAGGIASTGGIAAVILKTFGRKSEADGPAIRPARKTQ